MSEHVFWHLTFELVAKVDPHAKNQGHGSNGSAMKAHTDKQTNGWINSTKSECDSNN